MSTRGLMKSMVITGGAQSLSVIISIVRVKVFAHLLGPAGMGLLAIFQNIHDTTGQIASLGLSTSGVREVAQATDDKKRLSHIKDIITASLFLQATLAFLFMCVFGRSLGDWLIGTDEHDDQIWIIGLAIFVSLMVGTKHTVLQGLRHISDIAKITVISALSYAVFSVPIIATMGIDGLVWILLLQPITSYILAHYFLKKVDLDSFTLPKFHTAYQDWKSMVALGSSTIFGVVLTSFTLLAVNSYLSHQLSLDAVGWFVAAWALTFTYVGFIFNAVTMDFFPRLSGVINDHDKASELVDNQTEILICASGPILILTLGLSPWITTLFYNESFAPAAELIQLQTLGNIAKVASWPIGFMFLAAQKLRTFLIIQAFWNILFFVGVVVGVKLIGLQATGIAFTVAYVCRYLITHYYAYKDFGLRHSRYILRLELMFAVLITAVFIIAQYDSVAAAIISLPLSAITAVLGLRRIMVKVGPEGKYPSLIANFFRKVGWPIRFTEQ